MAFGVAQSDSEESVVLVQPRMVRALRPPLFRFEWVVLVHTVKMSNELQIEVAERHTTIHDFTIILSARNNCVTWPLKCNDRHAL